VTSDSNVASEAALEGESFAVARVTTGVPSSSDGDGMPCLDSGDDAASDEALSGDGSPNIVARKAGSALAVAASESPARPVTWARVVAAHAASHARARELWRFVRLGDKGVAAGGSGVGSHGPERAESMARAAQVVLPGSVYCARPLASSRLDDAARGTCKVWRLTPVEVRA
jgi:hypothetical protein